MRFSAQSPYVNLSVFDRYYLHGLYGHFRNPDGQDDEDSAKIAENGVEWITEEVENGIYLLHFPF